jgi:biotin synthase
VTGKGQKRLHEKAAHVRDTVVGNKVYFRGLIEFSNICSNDCFYCGIRSSNKNQDRYQMTKQEILECAQFCNGANYGSLVLQSGELQSKEFVDFIIDVVKEIKSRFDLGITLCLGEQTKENYKRFFKAGVHRYLLRIETSNKEHYQKLHPKNMDYDNRIKCLRDLKNIGFQVGTGVMIGSPFQTMDDLANDLLFFKQIDVDMVGMGPYIPHNEAEIDNNSVDKKKNLNLGLNMIALLRIMIPDINIASTTALQAIDQRGRELGLEAGANVIMPNLTPSKYRGSYKLYNGKPCTQETSEECMLCITQRIESTGLIPGFGDWGDSKHASRKR